MSVRYKKTELGVVSNRLERFLQTVIFIDITKASLLKTQKLTEGCVVGVHVLRREELGSML
jgi:hypothetical protein